MPILEWVLAADPTGLRTAEVLRDPIVEPCCGLAPRSSAPSPAWRLVREPADAIIHFAGHAPRRWRPLSSNLIRHQDTMHALAALLREVRACELCAANLPLGPRPVIQCHASARILIAGQAPGRKVHESGVPFQDASGDRLRSWLGITPAVFYDERQVAIVPMGFCFPGTGSSGDVPPRPECAPAWRLQLLGHLKQLHLTVVIGRYAQQHHMPEAGASVTEVVQAWRHHWPNTVPLPHPSPRNNRWLKQNPWFERELLPALQARVAEVLGDA